MRALSVRQPWAWAIARGHKAVLNCGGDTGFRGEVAVHASLSIDLEAFDSPLIRAARWDPGDPEATIGGIVAVASLVSICAEARAARPCGCGEWALPGAFHWRLADPRPLSWPVLTVGQQGVWELAPRVAADVARLLSGRGTGIAELGESRGAPVGRPARRGHGGLAGPA
jgi:hypothetical protein